jgi:tRNA (adenine22-N1)-methyltransferase
MVESSSYIPGWQISKRLQTLAEFVPDRIRVADIGGDHAFLLLHLAKQKRLKKGIVGEINRGPFENAKNRVRLMGYEEVIEVRLGDGLSVLEEGEVDAVVIAGMCGSLIANILEEGKEKLTRVRRLILQPNIGAYRVREWLRQNHFRIVAETIVEEAGILYEIIVAEPGEEDAYGRSGLPSSLLLEIGPVLWREKHPLLHRKVAEELAAKEKVYQQLAKGKSEEAVIRRKKLADELEQWRKVFTCLSGESN